ncbi:MAG TPA: 16S rRNA (adenine(1518)-N(6)/adenine(1519)-N(6))-dimethyltransferase RsmA [Acholeplasmataceae bacterium]|nr:16S rRNA (adenine(1518)-N(6)/adenine(1519)-N(6))-dimethyltransferase RsmA [Acholeplasmataceae bacterium]
MIGNIKKTTEILNKYGLSVKKSFGQNFLIDENILRKIVNVSKITKEDGVIEIGPGIGALTEHLLKNAKKVLAYEIDTRMIEVLETELKDYDNLKIINEDVLKIDQVYDENYFKECKRVVIVSNLPYYITTPIISKLLLNEPKIEEMYLMVQKEVGLRLSGKPKTKDYNALSVFMAYLSECRVEFDVSRNCFLPAPNVNSVVISIKRIEREITVNNESHFLKFIQNIFIQRRKTFVNNLSKAYKIDKEKVMDILRRNGYKESLRSEELSLEEIYKLYKEIFTSPYN